MATVTTAVETTAAAPRAESETAPKADRDSGYRPYLFTADQAFKMVDAGIIPEDGSTELLDGVLYQVTVNETHNLIVGMVGDLIRPLVPAEFHVREEKSVRHGERSLPEPDVAVCRGARMAYRPNEPTLDKLALVVEVCHHSDQADRVTKFAMYAAAGVPCYWIVDAEGRSVAVWTGPARAEDGTARYEALATYKPGQSIPVVVDGAPRGEVGVAEIFPPEPKPGAEANS